MHATIACLDHLATTVLVHRIPFAMREHEQQRALTADLLRMWRAGQVRPHVHRTYSLDDAVLALEEVATRRVMGKAVIVL